jgi:phosphatidylglycerophosphatase A
LKVPDSPTTSTAPVVKESSDEFNPSVLTAPTAIDLPPRHRTSTDRIALMLATCGVGHVPLAPGTWGALVGVGIYLLFNLTSSRMFALAPEWNLAALEALRTSGLLIVLIALVLIGIWAATRVEPMLGRKDPGAVVIDEVAGQVMTFIFVPRFAPWWMIVVGFVLFRVFDIWKPYPIRRLEALESGLGIMADDLVAAAYAGTIMAMLVGAYLLF